MVGGKLLEHLCTHYRPNGARAPTQMTNWIFFRLIRTIALFYAEPQQLKKAFDGFKTLVCSVTV